ncbi:DUF7322 domain-containing protein [Natrinema caseinilyticum]|uniref:DUF7322 domain-containing protein n=1 Tax=Natrinema caseinilyticum TaxID=2961570 RepID=UPI0020C46028|nr:hypothetical protein [Natrinema caseinilyticum]
MVFDSTDDESADRDPDPEGTVRDPGEQYRNPEEKFMDPDHDSLTIPQIGVEEPDADTATDSLSIPSVTTPETDAPDDVLETFWVLVVVLNGAILALSLGALFLLFEGDTTRGGSLLAIGLVTTGFSAHRYRQFRRAVSEPTEPADTADSTDATGSGDDRTESDETLNTGAPDDTDTTSTDDSGKS